MLLNGINCIQNSNTNAFDYNNRIFLPPAMEEDILHKVSFIKKTMNVNLSYRKNNQHVINRLSGIYFW